MSGNKKIIHFLSASDRINFGDLLFPIIFKKVAEIDNINIDFFNYGLIKSDLSYFGALPTLSFRKFQKNVEKNNGSIIIGGGEIFFPKWKLLYSYINPHFKNLLKNKYFRIIENKFTISKWLLSNGNISFPFTPNFKNSKIYYNAVGGTLSNNINENEIKIINKNLLAAKYISVRDSETSNKLLDLNILSKVVPDSALIISDIFPKSKLVDLTTIKPNIYKKKYIFLQMAINKGPLDINSFIKKIDNFCEKHKCNVISCPIGLASGHEDNIILKNISKKSNKIDYIQPKNIYDIMILIASSMGYLGTSLHGLITAQSYNVVFAPLNKQVLKMSRYCSTWTSELGISENFGFDEWDNINQLFENWDYTKSKNILETQKLSVYNNFNKIYSLINDDEL